MWTAEGSPTICRTDRTGIVLNSLILAWYLPSLQKLKTPQSPLWVKVNVSLHWKFLSTAFLYNASRWETVRIATPIQGRSQPRRSGGAPASGRWAREWSEQMSNLPPRGSGGRDTRIFFCIFWIQNPALCAFFGSENGHYRCFYQDPYALGNKNCWKRLPNEARRAENRGQRRWAGWGSWGGGSKLHQLGGLAVM